MNQRTSAILLCAGYGTRMGALTAQTPKPLLPVAGRPVLDYLLTQIFKVPAIDSIHVVSNARYFRAFEEWADNHRQAASARGISIEVHNDGSTSNADRLGAIGDLDFVLRSVDTGRALVTAGDNILCFDWRPMWQRFLDRGVSTVMALHEASQENLRRTGVLELADDDRVVRLVEKPREPPSSWACPSFYCLDRSALDRVTEYLSEGKPRDEIGRFIADLVGRQAVYAWQCHGERLHVGSPQELERAERLLLRDRLGADERGLR